MRSLLIIILALSSCDHEKSQSQRLPRIDQAQLYVNVSEREENIIHIMNGGSEPIEISSLLRFQWKNAEDDATNTSWEEVLDIGCHTHYHPTIYPDTSVKLDHFNFRGHFKGFDYNKIYFRVGVTAGGLNDDGIYESKTFWGRPILEKRN